MQIICIFASHYRMYTYVALGTIVDEHEMMVKFSVTFRLKTKAMFYHGYDSYLNYAYPYDELKPLSCSGQDTWGR